MKKFISTWFGIGIFDEDWYENRLTIYEEIALKSFDKINDNDTHLIFYIDSNIPKSAARRLIKLQEKYSFIRLEKINFYFEMTESFKEYIIEHSEPEEFIAQIRLDADDVIDFDVFKEFEQIVEEKNSLITFEDLYYYQIGSTRIAETVRPFMALNMFFVTNNRDLTIYEASHNKMNEWAKENSFEVKTISSEKPYYIRTLFPDQDSNALEYFSTRVEFRDATNQDKKNFKDKFNLDLDNVNIGEELINQKFNYKWDYTSPYVMEARKTHNNLKSIKEKYKILRSNDWKDKDLLNCKTIDQYLEIFTTKENYKMILVAQDEASTKITDYKEIFKNSGIEINLSKEYFRKPYILIYDQKSKSQKELFSTDLTELEYKEENIYLRSVGYNAKSACSIIKDDINYCKNKRGLNIIVCNENGNIVDSINIDTYIGKKEVFR